MALVVMLSQWFLGISAVIHEIMFVIARGTSGPGDEQNDGP